MDEAYLSDGDAEDADAEDGGAGYEGDDEARQTFVNPGPLTATTNHRSL